MADDLSTLYEHILAVANPCDDPVRFDFKWHRSTAFDYIVYDIAGQPRIGTAIEYMDAEAARGHVEATSPAFSVAYDGKIWLVYNYLLSDLDDWVTDFKKKWAGKFSEGGCETEIPTETSGSGMEMDISEIEIPKTDEGDGEGGSEIPTEAEADEGDVGPTEADKQQVAEMAIHLICKVSRAIKQQMLAEGNSYLDMKSCFGVNQKGELIFVKAAEGEKRKFRTNVSFLGEIAKSLLRLDLCDVTKNSFTSFRAWMTGFSAWTNQSHGITPYLPMKLDFLAANYIICTLDAEEVIQFIMNVGTLANSPHPNDKLIYNKGFQHCINTNATALDWRAKVKQDPLLKAVYDYPRKQGLENYSNYELPVFCLNSFKHYGNKSGRQFDKKVVLQMLCDKLENLPVILFEAYAQAVISGYRHSVYQMVDVFTKLI